MDKAQAKKYIKGRQLEIKYRLEMALLQPLKKELREELSFLRYVNNVLDFVDDECDDIPQPTVFEHNGYILQQSGYNNHCMIFKDGKMVMHFRYGEMLNQKKAKEAIDFYIDCFTYGRLADETERIIRELEDEPTK